jgi:hypothetical protein
MKLRSLLLLSLVAAITGHGQITFPPSTRHGGSVKSGNRCAHGSLSSYCSAWFSNIVTVPGAPRLPNGMRTLQLNVTSQPEDVYAKSPWRAPGSAPVFGSGCGVGGGSKEPYLNGGECPHCPQGLDGKLLPPVGEPAEWTRGGTAEVAWAIAANHGGGYSWRLCPAAPVGDINETCFQSHQLDFAGNTSDVLYTNGTRVAIPRTTTRTGTYPPNSQWARNPIPGCYLCDAYQTCGATLAAVSGIPAEDPCTACATEDVCKATNATLDSKCVWRQGYQCQQPPDVCKGPKNESLCEAKTDAAGNECEWVTQGSDHGYCHTNATMSPALLWDQQINCLADCDGGLASKALGSCPEGTAIFPEPVPGLSGWGKGGWKWSIADKVKVPSDLEPGPYLLSWRWDCEESIQVWQNCADVLLV